MSFADPDDFFEEYEPQPPRCSALRVAHDKVDHIAGWLPRLENVKWTKVHRGENGDVVLMIRLEVYQHITGVQVPPEETAPLEEMTLEVPVEWDREYYLTRSNDGRYLEPKAIKYHDHHRAWRRRLS